MKEEIKKWLQGPKDFKEGVALYDKYGSNKFLIKSFHQKESQTTRDKLLYELTKMADVKNSVTSIPAISQEKQQQINESLQKITGGFKAEPPTDPDLERRRAKLFNDRARLSNQLRECNTDAERKAVIEKIKGVESEYYGVIQSIKHVELNGTLPEAAAEKMAKNSKYEMPATLEDKMKALLNARSRKSKAIAKAKKLGDTPEGLKRQKEIKQEENFITALESALK
jgi:hypothetical protein